MAVAAKLHTMCSISVLHGRASDNTLSICRLSHALTHNTQEMDQSGVEPPATAYATAVHAALAAKEHGRMLQVGRRRADDGLSPFEYKTMHMLHGRFLTRSYEKRTCAGA